LRIIIVDDHSLFLQGISALLERQLPAASIETYNDISSAYQSIFDNKNVDLVLADIYMPKVKGKTIMELLYDASIFVPILLVSATEDIQLIKRSLDLHASGFVHKSSKSSELLLAIRSVIENGAYLNKNIAERLAQIQQSMLSNRQLQVLELLAEGLSNRQIGGRLEIGEVTVKTHVSALFDYFNASNRLDCIRKAERGGMVAVNHGQG